MVYLRKHVSYFNSAWYAWPKFIHENVQFVSNNFGDVYDACVFASYQSELFYFCNAGRSQNIEHSVTTLLLKKCIVY